jgi:hypothetical protein
MSRVLPADAANTSDLACIKPAAGPCFGIRQVQNAPVTCSEPHPRASTSRKALTGSQSPASLPQSKEVKAAALLAQSKARQHWHPARAPRTGRRRAAGRRPRRGSSGAPSMGAGLRVRVSITEVDCTNREGRSTGPKVIEPKASASPRGEVRRKPEANLRFEEHESHTRPGQPGELASNSEARCNQGLTR